MFLTTKEINVSNSLKYFSAIKSVIPYAYDIKLPKIQGTLKSSFIVKSIDGTFVCKFNHRDLAMKNAAVSRILNNAYIQVPNIRVVKYNDSWIEVYKFIPSRTLYESVGTGLSGEKLEKVYRSLVDIFAKMDTLSLTELSNMRVNLTHQVAKINISDTNNAVFGALFSGAVKLMNNYCGKSVGLYHCGITPKNVILDDDYNVSGFVDMDEVAIADRNYAFGMMAAKYKQLGHNPMDLVEYYETISGNKLNHKKVKTITDLTNLGKSILWHSAVHRKTR